MTDDEMNLELANVFAGTCSEYYATCRKRENGWNDWYLVCPDGKEFMYSVVEDSDFLFVAIGAIMAREEMYEF